MRKMHLVRRGNVRRATHFKLMSAALTRAAGSMLWQIKAYHGVSRFDFALAKFLRLEGNMLTCHVGTLM
jgi:hypothetical protein